MRLREINDVTRFWSIIADIKVDLENDYQEIISLYQVISEFDDTTRVPYILTCENKISKLIDQLLENIEIFDANFKNLPFDEKEEIKKHSSMKRTLLQIKNFLD